MNKKQLNHLFFVIMGPSGSGKTEITAAVFPNAYKVVSHTTRPKRMGEIEGKDYYFETQQSFAALLAAEALAEHDSFNGYHYGVAIADIIAATEKHVAYDVLTFNGFAAIEKVFGDKVIPIYFEVSRENVSLRLKNRETDAVKIAERLLMYDEEIVVKERLKDYSNALFIDANSSFKLVAQQLRNAIKSF
ncbi:guanylate kinase [Enterococcus sp. LJL99]